MREQEDKEKLVSKEKRIQFVAASIATCALIISIPVAAWFGNQRRIIKIQKVQSPNILYLTAAHRQDGMYLNVDTIDADEIAIDGLGAEMTEPTENAGDIAKKKKITHKDYAFCVTGDSVNKFTIQLAYTTNNPFTYEVFAADEKTAEPAGTSGVEPDYVAVQVLGEAAVNEVILNELDPDDNHLNVTEPKNSNPPVTLYYQINTTPGDKTASGTLVSLNQDGSYVGQYLNTTGGGTVADRSYHEQTYDEYATDYVEAHAEPVYWQATGIEAFPGEEGGNANKKPFSRHFILRVKWDTLDNDSKETDIVYLTVQAES